MSSSAPEARAIALFQAGRLAEAEAAARELLASAPGDAQALHLLGCIRSQAGARDEALVLLDQAVAAQPRNASFLNNRARVLLEAGRIADAERDLRRAIQVEPRFLAALVHLGHVLQRQGRVDESSAAFRRAIALQPGDAAAHEGLGLALLARGDAAHAEESLRAALAARPGHAGTHNNLGVALQGLGRIDEAAREFEAATAADPGLADAWVNWGNALENRGDLQAARDKYARALALAPASVEAWLNAASNAMDLGLHDEARSAYQRALALRPGMPGAIYGLGLMALRRGDFAEGWDAFERRFDTTPPRATRREPPLPGFEPRAGARKRVAVWSEQGIGDQILFSTLVPELAADADACVEVDARLVAAYRRSVPQARFVAPAETAVEFARCEAQLALGSLPRWYRRDSASFARQPRRLLVADEARVREMRASLGEGPFIGISWRSLQAGVRHGAALRKSIPLANFARLARASGMRLLDLQYGDVDAERAELAAAHPGILLRPPGLDAFADLEGVLAAIECCERVVTASNATIHLAGALGKPATVVFLEARAPFHYWDAHAAGRSLWYPSVAIATDPRWRRWEEAFEALAL